MYRKLAILSLLVVALLASGKVTAPVRAQDSTEPVEGDPPVAALISVSQPDEDGVVTINGAQGAVFPAADVAIRNLYTEDIVYTQASITGSFSAEIYGSGPTPFLISPAPDIPDDLRNRPGSLPGGPATIVYSSNPVPQTATDNVTSLIVDGDLSDWLAYPDATLGESVKALINSDSLYVGYAGAIAEDAELTLVISEGNAVYELTVDPALEQAAVLRQIEPIEREPVTLASVVAEEDERFEVRLAIRSVLPDFDTVTLEQTFLRGDEEAEDVNTLEAVIPIVDESDGIVYPDGRMSGDFNRFYLAGAVAEGASRWWASGRIDSVNTTTGETVTIEMDVTLEAPELPDSLGGLEMIGQLGLQPVTVGPDGGQNVAALHSNNGWSNMLTTSGLAVDNVIGDLNLGEARVPPTRIIRRGNTLSFGMRFEVTIPGNLPPGLYVPKFSGQAQVGDGEPFAWHEGGVFGSGPGLSRLSLIRLPLVLNVGDVQDAHLALTLLHDSPSDGSRGILPDADKGQVALSNRVRFNSDTYILPPGDYPLEPYLLNQMPNAYDATASPLLPLLLPGGRLDASVTAPDGSVDDLSNAAVIQNRLSTAALDERVRFGAQPPVDTYRLMTSNPSYRAYPFEDYGEYTISLTGSVEDVNGNRYSGGGEYELLIAELFDLTPGVLAGAPFHVGDAFPASGHLVPGYPADVTVTVTLYGLDGEVTTREFSGQADRYGYFALDTDGFRFDTPGEYVIDYEARYTDADGTLWAASLRSAGVVSSDDRSLVAHGKRGLAETLDTYHPAWFSTAVYPPEDAQVDADARPNYPYFSGDVAVMADSRQSGLRGVMQLQDTAGSYQDWLRGTIPDYVSPGGQGIDRLAVLDALPTRPVLGGPLQTFGVALLPDFVVNNAYGYVSAVRPGVSVRQYVHGGDGPGLPLAWDGDDPLNGQIGAGADGLQPDDYMFLFGGVVVRNAEAEINQAIPYASFAHVTDADEPAGVSPPYHGVRLDTHVEPLLEIDDQAWDMLFHPTGVRPGQVMTEDSTLSIAGHTAPPLPSEVDVEVRSPSGDVTAFTGQTTSTGYYYDPEARLPLDETGVWQVEVVVRPMGRSSTGSIPQPVPTGSVPGALTRTFDVYIVPETMQPLEWSLNGDVDVSYRAGTRLNVTANVPAGWEDVEARFTLSTPSYVMDAGELTVLGRSATYQYNPIRLSADFPIEVSGDGDGPSGSDVVTLTFAITGLDEDDEPTIAIRRLHILHDRLLSVDSQVTEAEASTGE